MATVPTTFVAVSAVMAGTYLFGLLPFYCLAIPLLLAALCVSHAHADAFAVAFLDPGAHTDAHADIYINAIADIDHDTLARRPAPGARGRARIAGRVKQHADTKCNALSLGERRPQEPLPG